LQTIQSHVTGSQQIQMSVMLRNTLHIIYVHIFMEDFVMFFNCTSITFIIIVLVFLDIDADIKR